MADTEFGSPAPEDVEASKTTAAIAAGIPLEDEETDEMEAAYEATQREVEEDIHGPSEGTEQAEGQEPGEALLAGKYKTVEDLEKAYLHSESKIGELGPKASESQELRERLARLEGRAEIASQNAQSQQQFQPTQRQQTRHAFTAQRARMYVEQGFDSNVAADIAEKDALTVGMLVESEVNNRTQKYEQTYQDSERVRQLNDNAHLLRNEKDGAGNLLRPHWDDVVKLPEFEEQASNMDNFHTMDGLELAYLRTAPVVSSKMQQEASNVAGAAKADSSAAKRRASVGPAATPASKTPSSINADDAEIQAIYESAQSGAKAKNVFDGGTFD